MDKTTILVYTIGTVFTCDYYYNVHSTIQVASLLASAPTIKQEPPDIHGDGIALLLELESSHSLLMMLCYRDELSVGHYS